MLPRNSHQRPQTAAGFTLPVVLVVVGALLILAVGVLLVVGIERNTARSFSDRQRAELAARAGLEDLRGILNTEAANDDFLILQSTLNSPITAGYQSAPQLFLARGKVAGTGYNYRYIPLFSTQSYPATNGTLAAPSVEPLVGATANDYKDFTTLPYNDKVRASWLPVKDDQGRTIARYAYWVEDLQSRLDPKLTGNLDGLGQTHAREAYPFPAAGMDDPTTGALPLSGMNQTALYATDPQATEKVQGTLAKTVINNRKLLVSPDSALAASGIAPPLARLTSVTATGKVGELANLLARAADENLVTNIQSYKEQPLIPFADGLDPAMAGKPKLNLNALLAEPRASAITDFSNQVNKALPLFDSRKGGFPDNYVGTLAANAFDYADTDSDATIVDGCRGIDSYPLMSEIILHFYNTKYRKANGRSFIDLRCRLFVEFWNMSNKPTQGKSRVSFELKFKTATGIDAAPARPALDDSYWLDDPTKSKHDLQKINGKYWSKEIQYSLGGDQYSMMQMADITYYVDIGSDTNPAAPSLTYTEQPQGASGISHMWNSNLVERISSIDRPGTTVKTLATDNDGIANIPGHSYGPYGTFFNNMGDPRASNYLRTQVLGLNSYPSNITPNRRNIRRGTIYDNDSSGSTKRKHFGRVFPSEWPDGGHDANFGSDYIPPSNEAVLPTDPAAFGSMPSGSDLDPQKAPQRISNAGLFYSATELGNIYDPIMWAPTFLDSSAQSDFYKISGATLDTWKWPDALYLSPSSPDYCGGNTLRIGRPEHPKFDAPKLRAAYLLDLFHAGDSTSAIQADRVGGTTTINGHVNLNTATRDTIRALAAGILTQDPKIAEISNNFGVKQPPEFAPETKLLSDIGSPTNSIVADRVADAVIKSRPFASAADIATASEKIRSSASTNTRDSGAVFGNPDMYLQKEKLQWSDSAAEEIFARVYNCSTLRSRNFRVWVVGQSISPQASGSTGNSEVLAETRKVYTLFADPGARQSDGSLIPSSQKIKIIHENDF